MNESPTYLPRLASAREEVTQDEALWEASLAAYGEGDYVASLSNLIRYLDPDKLAEGAPLVGETIVLEHGSVRLHLTVTDERFSLRVPFVRMPAGGRAIALMRKALELSTDLNLSGFFLEDDALVIRSQDALSGCHPEKLLDIMLCICRVADRHDDLFTEKMGAEPLEPCDVEPWTGERLDAAHDALTRVLDEGIALANYWESKQSLRYAYFSLDMAMDRLTWILHPQGYMRSELGRIYNRLRDEDRAPAQRISEGKKLLQKLSELPREKLSGSLYEARFMIPETRQMDLEEYQTQLKKVVDVAKDMRSDRKYDLAVTVYLHNTYEDLRAYTLPAAVTGIFTRALEAAGGAPWRSAAEVFGDAYLEVMNLEEESEDATEHADDYYRKARSAMREHADSTDGEPEQTP